MKENVLSLLDKNTRLYGERIALGKRNKYGWKELTYKGLGLLTRQLASYLLNELQMQKGDRLAILSESMPEMGACVFASVISGMVTVPLDNKLTIYELESILTSAQPSVLAISLANLQRGLELQKRIPSIKNLILMDEHSPNCSIPTLYTLPDAKECKWRHRSLRDTAFIIYTSGTTGAPKGVQTTFGNMTSQVLGLERVLPEILPQENVNLLSILPMNHLFEMTVGFSTFLNRGASIFYPQSLKPRDVLGDMREKKIDFMIVVPAFMKLLKTTIEADIKSLPEDERILFERSYAAAEFIPDYSIRRQLFRSILAKFGGNFYGFITGGAPLDAAVGEFFERIGIKVFQCYGLTETSPIISIDRGEDRKLLSVGLVLDSYDAKIDEETGELLVKGPSVMKGYYNNPEKINRLEKELPKVFSDLYIIKSTPYFLEFSNKEGSKYCAVKFLQKYWGIDEAETLTIGDQNNDIALLKAGGIKVAMGNATEELKSIADYVTDTVFNDGFKKAMEKFITL